MTGSVRVSGLAETRVALARVATEILQAAESATSEGAEVLLADMRDRVPVLTGQTRDELEIRDGAAEGTKEVGLFETDHGAFPEFGTVDMDAEPFIAPSAEAERSKFPGRVAVKVKGAVS